MPVQTTYPGVYIQEVPSGSHAIAGVSTSVTVFAGAARMGPVNTPVPVGSMAEYVRAFGVPWDAAHPMGHCVAHFFANGGSEARIVRVASSSAGPPATAPLPGGGGMALTLTANGPGSWANRTAAVGMDAAVDYNTSRPGDTFNLTLTLRVADPRTGAASIAAQEVYQNLSMDPASPRTPAAVLAGSGLVARPAAPTAAPPASGQGTSTGSIAFKAPFPPITAANQNLTVALDGGAPVTIVIGATTPAKVDDIFNAINTAVGAMKPPPGVAASATADGRIVLTSATKGGASSVTVTPSPTADAAATLGLGAANGGVEATPAGSFRPAPTGSAPVGFAGGGDGGTNGDGTVTGADVIPPDPSQGAGIYGLGTLLFPAFNLLCLPDVPAAPANIALLGTALGYCAQQRAFLIVDVPPGTTSLDPASVGGLAAQGEHGAVYFPRLMQLEAGPGGVVRQLDLPPCGAVAGVIARIDASRGLWKAPAGLEAGISGISGLTRPTDDALSGRLNPRGVNVLRVLPGAGPVVWGARTLKGDDAQTSDFKYIPVRRMTDFIASSLYLGTQFAVFEPNDPTLWGQLRLAVGSFMRGMYRQGAFQQSTAHNEADSFFVVCDDTVNPQSEINLGRVNVVVGFAPLKPAEFVIVTITQILHAEG